MHMAAVPVLGLRPRPVSEVSGARVWCEVAQVAEQTRGWKAPELQRVPERITLSAAAHKPVDPDELAGITNWLEVRPTPNPYPGFLSLRPASALCCPSRSSAATRATQRRGVRPPLWGPWDDKGQALLVEHQRPSGGGGWQPLLPQRLRSQPLSSTSSRLSLSCPSGGLWQLYSLVVPPFIRGLPPLQRWRRRASCSGWAWR